MSLIDIDDFLAFCARTIDGMTRVIDRLSDEELNAVPDLAGANSPAALVTHALAASRYWTEHIVCGHPTSRRRADEFDTRGSRGRLHDDAAATMARLRELGPELDAATVLAHPAVTETPLDGAWTVGAALLHAYEELAQHLGHLELTADVLIAGRQGT